MKLDKKSFTKKQVDMLIRKAVCYGAGRGNAVGDLTIFEVAQPAMLKTFLEDIVADFRKRIETEDV